MKGNARVSLSATKAFATISQVVGLSCRKLNQISSGSVIQTRGLFPVEVIALIPRCLSLLRRWRERYCGSPSVLFWDMSDETVAFDFSCEKRVPMRLSLRRAAYLVVHDPV